MRKILVLLAMALATIPALADTLYLKNGSTLKGSFVGFENGEFIFELGNGNRVKFRANEVSRLTLDNDRRDTRNEGYPRREPNPPPVSGGSSGGGGGWDAQP